MCARWSRKVMDVRVLIIMGVVLRLVFLLSSAEEPRDAVFVADPYAYLRMADHAYHGRFFVSFRGFPTSYLSVGYPALLAVVRRLFLGVMSSWDVAMVLNVVSFVATAAAIVRFVAILGGRLALGRMEQRIAAMVAVALLAFDPDFVFATGLVMTELVAVAVLSWGIVLVSGSLTGDARNGPSDRWRTAAGAGLLGMTVFLRPSMLFLVVLVPLCLLRRRAWRAAGVCLVVSAVPLVPLALNNARVGAGAGITSATWMNVCDGLVNPRGGFEWRRECRVTLMPGEAIGPGTEARNTRWARKISLLHLRHDWPAWTARVPLRVGRSLWSGGWATEFSVRWAQNYVWSFHLRAFLWLSRVYFAIVGFAAVCQLLLLVAARRAVWWPIVVVSVGSLAGTTISFGQSRFGWPVAVLVCVPLAGLLAGRAYGRFSVGGNRVVAG